MTDESVRGKEVKTIERICDNCEHCEEDAKGVCVCKVGPREYTSEATEEVNHGDGEEE